VPAFSAVSLNLPPAGENQTDDIIARSRASYASSRAFVESYVNDRYLSEGDRKAALSAKTEAANDAARAKPKATAPNKPAVQARPVSAPPPQVQRLTVVPAAVPAKAGPDKRIGGRETAPGNLYDPETLQRSVNPEAMARAVIAAAWKPSGSPPASKPEPTRPEMRPQAPASTSPAGNDPTPDEVKPKRKRARRRKRKPVAEGAHSSAPSDTEQPQNDGSATIR
ncbi:MAG: hypothetical protein ACRER5_03835, partial [Pseudomonas sp.]